MRLQQAFKKLDNETQLHSIRVAQLCRTFGKKLGLDPKEAYRMGYYHDIGKLFIPEFILLKSGQLTKTERWIVDTHANVGFSMLSDCGIELDISVPILYHHGYNKPRPSECPNPTEKQIYMQRLLSTLDQFDAMTHHRSYREPVSYIEALEEIKKSEICSSTCIYALEDMIMNKEPIFTYDKDSTQRILEEIMHY